MAAVSTWSTTAGSNNSTPPDGWPEDQAPSSVNGCAREMMAAIKTWYDQIQAGTGMYLGTVQTLTGAGAVDITSPITHVATTGADALTLADGAAGQRKFIVMTSDGGAGTLTPTNLGNGTTITFDDVGDSADLLFTNSAWHFMGGTATLA